MRIGEKLVDWYRKNGVMYPWRRTRDPYAVWISEILLQQTRIPMAIPYYEKILRHYPTLKDLARAERNEFLALWSGIGYYRRAENMLRCAAILLNQYRGQFPKDPQLLMQLPGIGRYTAAALANVCFHRLTPAIDSNIARVLARITNNNNLTNSTNFRCTIEQAFLCLGTTVKPHEYFQALMELGEKICLSRPLCHQCPVQADCAAYTAGTALQLPRKATRKQRQMFHWYLLMLQRNDRFLYVENHKRSFLKQAWIYPDILSSTVLSAARMIKRFEEEWGIRIHQAWELPETIQHSITFRDLEVHVIIAERYSLRQESGKWLNRNEILHLPTTSLMGKIWKKTGNLIA